MLAGAVSEDCLLTEPPRSPPPRLTLHCKALLLWSLPLWMPALGTRAQDDGPVTPIQEAREVSAVGTVLRVKGVVTAVSGNLLFMQDGSHGIAIRLMDASESCQPGDVLIVTGSVSNPSSTPMLRPSHVEKVGTAPLPEPEPVTADGLNARSLARDQRVRLTGSVHDVARLRDGIVLQVWNTESYVTATWPPSTDEGSRRPDEFLDAIVEITGVAATPTRTSDRALPVTVHMNALQDLRVVRTGSADVFSRPVRTLAALRGEPSPYAERFRVEGMVTYASPAGWFYIDDHTGTGYVAKPSFFPYTRGDLRPRASSPPVRRGDVVEVVAAAFHLSSPEGKFMPWLLQSEWRVLRHDVTPPFLPLTPKAVLSGSYDGANASITGRVAGINVARGNNGLIAHTLTIQGEGGGFLASMDRKSIEKVPFKVGDYVRVNGIVRAGQDRDGSTRSFSMLFSDVRDVQPEPEPATPRHLLQWFLLAAAVASGALIWIILLRRQVSVQTARLRDANEQLQRFKQIVETSTDFVAMATLENKPLYMNPAGRQMLGIPLDADLTAIDFEDISTPDGRQKMAEGLPHAFEHGHWHSELNVRRLTGEEVPVSFLGLVIKSPDGTPQYISSIARDMSERHALEQKLRQSNADLLRFKAIADTMKDLVAMAGFDKNTLYMNAAGRAMLGIGLDEDAASLVFDSIYTQETLERFEREGYAHAFEHGHWNAEITMRHRDGSVIPVAFSGLVLYNPDGSPLCMSCIAHDLTQRQALERQLRTALDHERELNQLKGTFVNTISHEFRTPLGIILFASSMLRRFNARFSASERIAQLDAIDEAVGRMNELVEQALSLGRAEVAAPRKEVFQVPEFCERITSELMTTSMHRCPIFLECEGDLPPASSDPTMLRTILGNLLSNAVKYSPSGSRITLSVHRAAAAAVFVVHDQGPGLRDEDLPNLFHSFHRGKAAEGVPGTGLGLAIVKRCTESLGGRVMARNASEGGAEFTVEIPNFFLPA